MMHSDSSPKPTLPRARLLPGVSLRVGDKLGGRFRVESLLRDGASAATFAAFDEMKKSLVAIELLFASGEGIEDVRRDFVSGARASFAVQSEHVARTIDVGMTSDGLPWVAREESPPRSLANVLADEHFLPTQQAVDIALAVCDALVEAHTHDLVHGHLGPRSVHLVWSEDGSSNVVLVDLGTSSALSRIPIEASVLRAPEQLERDGFTRLDERADVWGIGVLLYSMLAGSAPFVAESPSAVNLSVALDEPPSLAGVPDEVADLVERCLAKNPALRPASLVVVAEALAPFATDPKTLLERIRMNDSSPTLLVKKEEYMALAAEQSEREKNASDADPDTTARRETLAAALARASVPPAPPRTTSIPPLALSLRDERERHRGNTWKAACLVAAAICLATTAFLLSKPSSPAQPASSPVSVTTIATAVMPGEPPPPDLATAATIAQANANLLPDAPKPVATAKPEPKKAHKADAKKAPAHAEASAEPPPPTETVTPKPEPKASDDDLRRFLDDRR